MQIASDTGIVSPGRLFAAAARKLAAAASHVDLARAHPAPNVPLVAVAINDASSAMALVRSAITPATPMKTALAGEAALHHAAAGVTLLESYVRHASEETGGIDDPTSGPAADWMTYLLGSALTEFAAAESSLWPR